MLISTMQVTAVPGDSGAVPTNPFHSAAPFAAASSYLCAVKQRDVHDATVTGHRNDSCQSVVTHQETTATVVQCASRMNRSRPTLATSAKSLVFWRKWHRWTGWIEANSTYRGWFVGGNQAGEWGNRSFVSARGAGHGELGSFFSTLLSGSLKMGDSPSVAYLLRDTRDDPTSPGVGRAVRACVGWPQDNLRSPDHSVGFG
jgi:hypothetical protein